MVAGTVLVTPLLPAQTAADALKLREEMATAIIKGQERGDSALARLQGGSNRSGMALSDDDGDLAYATLDMGLRLIGARRPEEAERFLIVAERSLTKLVQKTPDSDATAKARHLATLAFIRSRFLNRDADAKAALDAADRLRPDDPLLNQMRDRLGSGKGKYFQKTTPRG